MNANEVIANRALKSSAGPEAAKKFIPTIM